MMFLRLRHPTIRIDTRGGVLVEVSVALTFFFVFVFGVVDFLLVFWELNAAAKAVQLGARIASVSSPVAQDLTDMDGLSQGGDPGDPFPDYEVVCDGGASPPRCDCTGAVCSEIGGANPTYSATAMNWIVFGRGNTTGTCPPVPTSSYFMGMCHLYPRLEPENIRITYRHTGLGFVTRPGGPVPTITLEIQNLPIEFFFIGDLLDVAGFASPFLTTTITGEDLSGAAP